MEEDVIYSTSSQLEEFKDSLIWKDLVNTLTEWDQSFDYELSAIVDDAETKNPTSAAVLLHLGDINGRKKAVAYFLNLLDDLIEKVRQNEKESKNGRRSETDY